ncbi:hypothetical protein ACJW30_02G215700 [Castanea mollissima]
MRIMARYVLLLLFDCGTFLCFLSDLSATQPVGCDHWHLKPHLPLQISILK